MFNPSLFKKVQEVIAENPDKRVLPLSFDGMNYFIKRRMSNGRNAFAKQNPSAAFWCEAYKIMTVNSRLPLAPKIVLLDEDFFVMENVGRTLQGVAKEESYADVRLKPLPKPEKAWPDSTSLDSTTAARPCAISPMTVKPMPLPSSTGKMKRNLSMRRPPSSISFSSFTAVFVKTGPILPSSMPP